MTKTTLKPASEDFVKGYDRGYADAREAAAQEMAKMYDDLCSRQTTMVHEISKGNKMICDLVLSIIAPVQTKIRDLKYDPRI